MSENSYQEVFTSKVDFPKPFQRTGKFPLDRTDMFSSYEDAVKYAKGDRKDPDSRGLCGTSYVGQTITVYENNSVSDYKIMADRTLRKARVLQDKSYTLEAGELSIDITIPAEGTFLYTKIYDGVTKEQIFTDVNISNNVMTISIAEAHVNPLDIVVSYYI